ncbi:MAG TPA: ATP-grasp domain-containing protein [Gaiellaceae bacterium]|nr:ATP-grasp domain-containing protein [Gaiellaceae bacterium]
MERAPRSRPRLLVLGAGPAQIGLLRAARKRDLFVIAVDRDPSAPGFAYADKRALVSSEDEPGIDRLARAESVDGIISPGADWPVGVAARVAERLGLAHPIDGATAALATTKSRQRERFAAAGVPQPQLLDEPRAPCVVKAPDRQGQRGLTFVRTDAELPAAIEAALEASRNGTYIVEEYVDGPEVTVNAVSVDGVFHCLAVTDRLTADPPAFGVALAHAWPCAERTQPAVDAARGAAEALGIRNGPTYTQIRLGPRGAQVIEVAARLGGGHDAELVEAATGVGLNDLALDFALGEEVSVASTERLGGGACVVFLVAPEGELVSVEGRDEAVAAEGVLDVRIYREPGRVFGPFLRGADRAGAVIAVGDNRDDALTRARAAANEIRFHTK